LKNHDRNDDLEVIIMAPGEASGFPPADYDPSRLPDFDIDFITSEELRQFEDAINAPVAEPVVAINDWRPIRQRVRKSKSRRKVPRRSKDETREGILYSVLKWPFLVIVFGWIIVLGLAYILTRLYIYLYEHFVSWTGRWQ
jgi:hypothetical protein